MFAIFDGWFSIVSYKIIIRRPCQRVEEERKNWIKITCILHR